jgi:hypothetical protein
LKRRRGNQFVRMGRAGDQVSQVWWVFLYGSTHEKFFKYLISIYMLMFFVVVSFHVL